MYIYITVCDKYWNLEIIHGKKNTFKSSAFCKLKSQHCLTITHQEIHIHLMWKCTQAHTHVEHTPFSPRPPSERSKPSCQNSSTSIAAKVRQAGWGEQESTHTTHTSARCYVMDSIRNDSPGPRCRPGTHLVGASPSSHDQWSDHTQLQGPTPPFSSHICSSELLNPHTYSEVQKDWRTPSTATKKKIGVIIYSPLCWFKHTSDEDKIWIKIIKRDAFVKSFVSRGRLRGGFPDRD